MKKEKWRLSLARFFGTLLCRIRLASANPPRRHSAEQAVSHDERVKQNRSKMGDKRQEQKVSENGVRPPQKRVQHHTVRKNRWKMQRPIQYDRIARRRQHPPADQWEHKQQRIQQYFGCVCDETLPR